MKPSPFMHASLLATVALVVILPTLAQTPPANPQEMHYSISTGQTWTDTGLDVHAGDSLEISAQPDPTKGCDPAGKKDTTGNGLVSEAPAGALIARVSDKGAAELAGTNTTLRVANDGRLFLGVNAQGKPPCAGAFAVVVHVLNAAAPDVKQKLAAAAQTWLSGQFGTGTQTASAATNTSASTVSPSGATNANAPSTLPGLKVSDTPLDGALRKDIDGLPRRVNDEFKNQGDMVNFVIVGSQQQVQSALEAATWHIADTDNREAAIKAVLQTYEKKDYLQMPMSELYLFGRVQDYGYEMAEPYSVVASRHHFRLWKAPFTYQGQTVWVGAGTHDVGFEKDQRNGKVTHKIDPAVDGERTNIGASLQKADKLKSLAYYLPPDPIQEAKNATGGGYHSDGRILVIFLK